MTDNQHRKIRGYRELSQEEIDLMNRIKELGPVMDQLIEDIYGHITNEAVDCSDERADQMLVANPILWANEGRMELQKGLMFLTRAVAQPQSF